MLHRKRTAYSYMTETKAVKETPATDKAKNIFYVQHLVIQTMQQYIETSNRYIIPLSNL